MPKDDKKPHTQNPYDWRPGRYPHLAAEERKIVHVMRDLGAITHDLAASADEILGSLPLPKGKLLAELDVLAAKEIVHRIGKGDSATWWVGQGFS